jgi:hypothetical protein
MTTSAPFALDSADLAGDELIEAIAYLEALPEPEPEPFAFLEGAEFTVLPSGWIYSSDSGIYRLDGGNGPGGACIGTLEAWNETAYYVDRGDWSTKDMRHKAARILARGNAELEDLIRADLFRFRLAILCTRIRADLDSINYEQDLPEPWGRGVDLFITNLDPRARRIIYRNVERLGGLVQERKSA